MCLFMGLLKSTLFEFFFLTPLASSKPLCSKKSKKTLILAFEANSALSRQNGLFSFSKISNNRDLCLKKVKPPHLWTATNYIKCLILRSMNGGTLLSSKAYFFIEAAVGDFTVGVTFGRWSETKGFVPEITCNY